MSNILDCEFDLISHILYVFVILVLFFHCQCQAKDDHDLSTMVKINYQMINTKRTFTCSCKFLISSWSISICNEYCWRIRFSTSGSRFSNCYFGITYKSDISHKRFDKNELTRIWAFFLSSSSCKRSILSCH